MRRTAISAGELTTRITVQEETRVSDSQGGFTKTWGAAGHTWQAWARKKYISGGDQTEEEQTVGRQRIEYVTRRRRDVSFTAAMRVIDGTVTLAITSVVADDDDITAQKLVCEEVPS